MTSNDKSSPVPPGWWPQVYRWLNRMGYRLLLRKLVYPSQAEPNGKLTMSTWWENKEVAPRYRRFPLAFRLRGNASTEKMIADVDVRDWPPGGSEIWESRRRPRPSSHGS